MSKELPSSLRSELIAFLDDPKAEEQTFSSANLGYAITAEKRGGEVHLACPDRWTPHFVQHFDYGEDFVRVLPSGITAHERVLRESLKTDTDGFLTRRERFALLDEEDRAVLAPSAQRLRSVLLSVATARADEGKDVAVYTTVPGSVVCMDLLEAADGLGVRFEEITHVPLEIKTETGSIRAIEVPDTTAQQTPAEGRGIDAGVHIYLDAGKMSFKQVEKTAVPARFTSDIEIIAGTARPLAHNRPPTGFQAALSIFDEPRLYRLHG